MDTKGFAGLRPADPGEVVDRASCGSVCRIPADVRNHRAAVFRFAEAGERRDNPRFAAHGAHVRVKRGSVGQVALHAGGVWCAPTRQPSAAPKQGFADPGQVPRGAPPPGRLHNGGENAEDPGARPGPSWLPLTAAGTQIPLGRNGRPEKDRRSSRPVPAPPMKRHSRRRTAKRRPLPQA